MWRVHVLHQLLDQIPNLGLSLEMIQEKRGHVAERFFERETFTRARRDLLAALRQIFFERFGVTRQLRAELFDLATQITCVRVFHAGFLLTLAELLAACFEERIGCSCFFEERAKTCRISACALIGLRSCGGCSSFRCGDELTQTSGFVLLRGNFTQRARFFVRELFDLTTDFRTQRATTTLE